MMRDAVKTVQRDPDAAEGHALLRGVGSYLFMRRTRLVGDSAPRFFLEAESLWGFCVAEFFQSVDGGTVIRSCPRCGKWFTLGKVGKPPLYCSAACKVAMHRKTKRAREQRASNVVRLRARGGGR